MLKYIIIYATIFLSLSFNASAYPDRPIRVVTNAIGGAGDLTARAFVDSIKRSQGWSIVVDNRGGSISTNIVATSQNDGHTILIQSNATWINPVFDKNTSWRIDQLQPITQLVSAPNILIANGQSVFKSVKDMVEFAKLNPGQLNASRSSVGSTTHIAILLFNKLAGVDIVDIPYKDYPQSIFEIAGPDNKMVSFAAVQTSVVSLIEAGKLKALATTGTRPFKAMPKLPTIASVYPDFEVYFVSGVWVPKGTDSKITSILQQRFKNASEDPLVIKRLNSSLFDIVVAGPDQFEAMIAKDTKRWERLLKKE